MIEMLAELLFQAIADPRFWLAVIGVTIAGLLGLAVYGYFEIGAA